MKRLLILILVLALMCCALPAAAEDLFAPGTYEGAAGGFHGQINVTVEVTKDAIASVTVGENEETYHVGDAVFPILEKSIVENQSLADVVTGATISSRGTTNAVIDALKKAGASDETINALKTAPIAVENPGDTETDIVIVGAGVGGMMAAAEAADAGANVILLEKNTLTGGSARISAGAFMVVGSDEITDTTFTAEDIHRWFDIQSGPVLNDPVFYEIFNNTMGMFDSLKAYGLEYRSPGPNQAKAAPIFRCFRGMHYGTSLVDTLTDAVVERLVDLRCNTSATALVYEDGKVAGVKAKNAAGEYIIRAKKVILATGGFTYDEALMEQYAGTYADAYKITATGATGDGHYMGLEAGGHLIGEGVLQIYCTSYDPSLDGNQPGYIPLMVDSNANQMCALDEYYGTITTKIQNLPDQKAYAIYSSDNMYVEFDYPTGGMKPVDMDAMVEKGRLVKADTIEKLAEKIGLDPAALVRSVDEHNWYYDLQINDAWGTPAASLQPIKTGPYYAAQQVACVMGTITGLEINTDMQVVNENGEPIENLYAVGELIFGNVFNKCYPMSGTAIGITMSSGRLAALHAVENMK